MLLLAPLLLSTSGFTVASPSIAPTLINPTTGPMRCEIWDTVTRTTQALAPEQTEVRAVLTDGIAEVEVVQTFVSPLSYATEAKYRFPLPHEGSVHGMRYRQEGVWRSAVILRKATAQAIYDSVQNAGGSAGMLTQERADIFTQSLTKIVPGDTVEVRIRLSMPLNYKDGQFEFAFPTMIGARCCNTGTPPIYGTLTGWNPPADVEGPRIRFLVALQTGYAITNITSPTHPVRSFEAQAALDTLVQRGLLKGSLDLPLAIRHAVLLQPLNTFPNSDFVLRFSRAGANATASSAVWPDTSGWKYFRLEAFPDSTWFGGARPDVDVMLLLDRSGSQSGWPLDYEKTISKLILDRLRVTDRLCVMGFDTQNDLAFSDTLRNATLENIGVARAYIDAQQVAGSTELYDAIKSLTAIPNPTNRHRLYVFLTDGFITNETEILDHLATLPDLQVITFGAGNNLNRAFLDEAALIGNGFSVPLVQNDTLTTRVDEAWSRLEAPALSKIRLDAHGLDVRDPQVAGGTSLYKGMSWTLLARTRGTGKVPVDVVGYRSATDSVKIPVRLDLDVTPTVGWAVPKLWARAAIANLEREQYRGAKLEDSIVAISLQHQVLSQYTAFLAWDGSASQDLSNVVYSVAPSYLTEVRRDELRKGPGRTLGFRIVRSGGVRTLELDQSLAGASVRILDMRGNLLWTSLSSGNGNLSLVLPTRLPALVVVQVRASTRWISRTVPTL